MASKTRQFTPHLFGKSAERSAEPASATPSASDRGSTFHISNMHAAALVAETGTGTEGRSKASIPTLNTVVLFLSRISAARTADATVALGASEMWHQKKIGDFDKREFLSQVGDRVRTTRFKLLM